MRAITYRIVLALACLFTLPTIGFGQSTVLFESDGSSLAPFICDSGQSSPANAYINPTDGFPSAPSIEFNSPNLTMRKAAIYTVPTLSVGQQFHGSLHIKVETSTGSPHIAAFGLPITSSCVYGGDFPGLGSWPIPNMGMRMGVQHGSYEYISASGPTSEFLPAGSIPMIPGQWHHVEFYLTPQPDGTNTFQFLLDGVVLASDISAEPVLTRQLGIEIGIGGSGEPTQVKFDNIKVEVLEVANLISHWDFESVTGTALVDRTGNGHDGTTFGNPPWVASSVAGGSNALQFSAGKAVEVPGSLDLLPGNHDYTLSAWFKTSVTGAPQAIIWPQVGCCGNASVLTLLPLTDHLGWTYHDDRIVCCVDPNRVNVESPSSVADGQWHQVVIVRDRAAGLARMYLGGVEVATSPDSPANITTSSVFAIGHRSINALGSRDPARFFQGLIDEIKIWDGALSPSAILALCQAEAPAGVVCGATPPVGDPPVISSISPTSDHVDAQIRLRGTDFGAPQGSGRVNFGPVSAEITRWFDDDIKFRVPNLPQGTYQVSVTTPGGTSNAKSFRVRTTTTTRNSVPGGTLNPSGSIAEPVNTLTGAYYTVKTDLVVPGKGLSFNFTRVYNSQNPNTGPLGYGWSHSYFLLLSEDGVSGDVTITQGDGGSIAFAKQPDDSYLPATPGLFDSLESPADGEFVLKRKNQTEVHFTDGLPHLIVDRNGNHQMLMHDGLGRLTMLTDASGRIFTFAYDSDDRIVSLTDPIGRTLLYAYDSAGDLISSTDASGAATQYSYDADHRMLLMTDPLNNTVFENIYDIAGRVISQENARGFVTLFDYDTPVSGTTSVTDPLGNVIQHVHDSSGRLVQVIDPLGNATTFVYNAQNQRSAVTDALARTAGFVYDAAGNLVQAIDPAGASSSFTYDTKNNLTSSTDRLGRTTALAHDSNSNLTSIQNALGHTTTFTYDSAGLLQTATNARGAVMEFDYDANGRLSKVTDAAGEEMLVSNDLVGRPFEVENQIGNVWVRTFDPLNRLLTVLDPLGNVTGFSYDGNGHLIEVADANGNSTGYEFDETNNLVKVTDAEGGITQYSYNGNGDLVGLTDANGHTRAYVYDPVRRASQVIDPLGRAMQYGYDAVGNIVQTVDAKGQANGYSYNVLNRLVSVDLDDGRSIGYVYDLEGNRLEMDDWTGATIYLHDDLNRVLSVSTPSGETVSYSYDEVGNRTGLTYPDGSAVAYDYDALNRLREVTDWKGGTTAYSYDAAGRVEGFAHPNGVAADYSYDAANRLTQVINANGGEVLSSFAYSLDAVGNRLSVLDEGGGLTSYEYDALYRLTKWQLTKGKARTWAYDPVGNRLGESGGKGQSTPYAYDAADQLLSAGNEVFQYDANGSLVYRKKGGDAPMVYAYDPLSRLTSVVKQDLQRYYQYDGDGNRVAEARGGQQTRYLNDVVTPLPVVLSEQKGQKANLNVWGLSLVSTHAAKPYYYSFDGLGSVRETTTDSATPNGKLDYDPWGNLTQGSTESTPSSYRFTGELQDKEAGLVYLRARYYDPSIARFTSRDPLPGSTVDPATLTPYTYVFNNPMSYVDPSGKAADSDGQLEVVRASVSQRLRQGPGTQVPEPSDVQARKAGRASIGLGALLLGTQKIPFVGQIAAIFTGDYCLALPFMCQEYYFHDSENRLWEATGVPWIGPSYVSEQPVGYRKSDGSVVLNDGAVISGPGTVPPSKTIMLPLCPDGRTRGCF